MTTIKVANINSHTLPYENIINLFDRYGYISQIGRMGNDLYINYADTRDAADAIQGLSGTSNLILAIVSTDNLFTLPNMIILPTLDMENEINSSDTDSSIISHEDNDRSAINFELSRSTNSYLESQYNLLLMSHNTLVKQLYNLRVELPQRLVINGLTSNFISLNKIIDMLQRNLIERYIIDPLLQPWAGIPGTTNRIITFFGKDGITYLVKARYDQTNNILYPPI
jgi:hypothetical protein